MTAGAPAVFPSLALPALAGGSRDLSRAPGRTLVCLGHGDCATTRLLLPYLERIHRRRRPQTEVVVVLQDGEEDARALVGELGLSAPVLLDPDPWALGATLGLATVPQTLLLAPGGTIERTWTAFRRADVEEMAALLGVARPVFTPEDPAPALRPG